MKHISPLLISTVAVFAPVKALIIVAGVLIFADLITGILAARKKGQEIKSAGLRRTVTKVFVYEAAIMLGFLVEHYMIADFFPVSKIAAGLISVVEFKSILENLDVINGNPVFRSLIEKLGSVNDAKKVIEQKIEEKKTPPKA
jgi:hypothetical protein